MTLQELNELGEEIERTLKLRTHPIAVKLAQQKADIPEDALCPRLHNGNHLAQCQAFSLVRRQGITVAMVKEDHWCFTPLLAYGMVKKDPDDEFLQRVAAFPCLEYGKYIGIVAAPLQKAAFEPDMVLIYAEPAQIRRMLMWIKYAEPHRPVRSEFDPLGSCAFAITPVMESGEYRITFPDPGEQARASAREDEVILTVPGGKLAAFAEAMEHVQKHEEESIWRHNLVQPDFPRPEFYTGYFEKWGLETEENMYTT